MVCGIRHLLFQKSFAVIWSFPQQNEALSFSCAPCSRWPSNFYERSKILLPLHPPPVKLTLSSSRPRRIIFRDTVLEILNNIMSPPFNQSNANASSTGLPQLPRNSDHAMSSANMSLLGLQSRSLALAWRDEGASPSSSPRSGSLRSVVAPYAAVPRGGSTRAVTREEHLVSVIDAALNLFEDPSDSSLPSSSLSSSSSSSRDSRNDSDRKGGREGRQ